MALVSCSEIQNQLDDSHFKNNYKSTREPASLAGFLTSDANTNNVLQSQIDTGDSKYKEVKLVWQQQYLESSVSTTVSNNCTSSTSPDQVSKIYTIDPLAGIHMDRKISLLDMAKICQDNPLFVGETVQMMMDAMGAKYSTIVANKTVLLSGKFMTDETNVTSNVKSIRTLKTDGESLTPQGFEDVLYACQNLGYKSIPYIFGFGEAYKYFNRLNFGCCTSDGLNIDSMTGQGDWIFGADKKVSTALANPNKFISISAGAAQVITWHKYKGQYNQINDESFKAGVVQDPKTGLFYDITINRVCEDIVINLNMSFDVVGLPDNLFNASDPYYGVTFVNTYLIDNA